NDLALQVGDVDAVVVDDADRADPGRREVHQQRRAEPAGADDQHARRQQLFLPLLADLVEDQVPRVAAELLFAQFHGDAYKPSNSGVDRYRSAKAGSTPTIVLSSISGRAPISSAAASAAPAEMPTASPSSRAALRAARSDVSNPMQTISSISDVSRMRGIKP